MAWRGPCHFGCSRELAVDDKVGRHGGEQRLGLVLKKLEDAPSHHAPHGRREQRRDAEAGPLAALGRDAEAEEADEVEHHLRQRAVGRVCVWMPSGAWLSGALRRAFNAM